MRSLGLNPTEAELGDMKAEVSHSTVTAAAVKTITSQAKSHRNQSFVLCTQVDAAGSGSIDCAKFTTVVQKKMKDVDEEEEFYEAFKVFDKDSSGKLTGADLRHIMANLGEKMTEEEVNEMILESGIECEAESQIDYKEFVKLLMSK
jgi:Ca2+-binding EF-hand superfamily protein